LKPPAVVKFRPFWMVKLPVAAVVAKLASASAPVDWLRNADVGPFSTMLAALVTMLAPVNWKVPEIKYVPPVSVDVERNDAEPPPELGRPLVAATYWKVNALGTAVTVKVP